MTESSLGLPEERPAPIFILVDDEGDVLTRLMELLPPEWVFVPVQRPFQVFEYAKRLRPTAILLADPVKFSGGGTRRLLARLRKDVGHPVIVLSESWDPEVDAAWKRLGAHACLPHPTRYRARLQDLRHLLQGFALGLQEIVQPASESHSVTSLGKSLGGDKSHGG